jgi:hypothetical protein
MSSSDTSVSTLIKEYQTLADKISKKDYSPTVGDRKTLQSLYPRYSDASNNDSTKLSDLNTLQELLQKCQQLIR